VSSAAPSIGAYLVVLVLWAALLAAVRRPTLWKGRSLLIVNSAIVAATAANLAFARERPGYGLAAFLLFLLAGGLFARDKAALLHVSRTEAEQILEKCLMQTRASYERSGEDYTVRTATENLVIEMRGGPPAIAVRFLGGQGSKKAELIRALFEKQFRGSFPTIRVQT